MPLDRARFPSQPSETDEADLLRPAGAVHSYLVAIGTAASGGHSAGERLIPVRDSILLGRREGDDNGSTVILDDRCVSSEHARITRSGDAWEIFDLESRNGTFVDGRPVNRIALRDGAMVSLGGYGMVFRFLSDDSLAAIREDLATPLGPVATASAAMALTLRKIRRLAPTTEEVLLTGETGSGKEIYARAIHRASGRPGPFIALNCAALPTELVESELFGYLRGAHSQASQNKRG